MKKKEEIKYETKERENFKDGKKENERRKKG